MPNYRISLKRKLVNYRVRMHHCSKNWPKKIKNLIDDDKQNRQIKGDWESKERKYIQEINGFKSQIKTLEQTQLTLESNLNTLKDGNDKTMELKSLQFAERE